jgi:hypothetical protein
VSTGIDDREEASLVKKALSRHMDLDTPATWGVFCDQICPQDEPMADAAEEGDEDPHGRIRTLVLSYLAHEGRPHIARHVKKPENEQVLVRGLTRVSAGLPLPSRIRAHVVSQAIPKLNSTDIRTIVLDILLPLPSYVAKSSRMVELNEFLLARAAAGMTSTPPTLDVNAQACLSLALDMAVDLKLVSPVGLLKWLDEHVLSKAVLEALPVETCQNLISITARAVAACGIQAGSEETSDAVKKLINNAGPLLVEVSMATHMPFRLC